MGEIVKERFLGIDWVLSEKLYCLFCGHQGLWLGDGDEWIEHFCTACDTLSLVQPMVMELITAANKKQRRDALSAREKDVNAA